MRPSRVRQRWEQDRAAFVTTVHLTDPSVAELASLMGFDCIWIDMEHHATSVTTAAQMMRAVRAGGGADVMARPGKGELMRMARMLEAGAQGILYPRCDDADEAKQVVRWAKFAPLGERGFDGANADNAYATGGAPADYTAQANATTWLAVQIESPDAAAQARAIAEVEGVDLLFFGPADYSLLSGRAANFQHPETLAAMKQVCADALAAGKRFGTLCFSPDHARQMLDAGATLIGAGGDIGLVRQGFERLRDAYTPLGFQFE